jgi:branched-chain amino acid transport system permease protein
MRRRAHALWQPLLGGLALLVLVLAPLWFNSYVLFVLGLFFINLIAALGLNLVMGYTGLVSLGHAGFAAIGAYTTALLVLQFGLSYWLALLIGALGAAVVGFLIGLPSLRLSPLYLAMVTITFGQVVTLIALNGLPVTRGPNGLRVPAPSVGSLELDLPQFYYVLLVGALLLLLVARNVADSPLGRAFLAVRESQLAAQSLGVSLPRYKTTAFALSAAYAGLAGGLYVGLGRFITPDAFNFGVSMTYLTMNVVGGMGTLAGSLVGAAIFTLLPEVLRGFSKYRELLAGALLLVFLLFMPYGVTGLVARLGSRVGRAGDDFEGMDGGEPALRQTVPGEPRVG